MFESSIFKRVLVPGVLLLALAFPLSAQQSTTVRGYTLTFDGVTYDQGANTSTWSYTLIWAFDKEESQNELSHLTIGFCTSASVVAASPTPSDIGYDGSTGLTGIKWDVGQAIDPLPSGVPLQVSFTLDGMYAVTSVAFSAKAGNHANIGVIDGPSCDIVDPSISVEKSCPGAAFVGDPLSYTITVTNDGNVALTNVHLVDALIGLDYTLPTLGAGLSFSKTGSYTSSSAGAVTNTATVSSSFANLTISDEASCSTDVYALSVSKTANTSYSRDWNWTFDVSRTGNDTIEVCAGQSGAAHFRATASRNSTDSNFVVSGTITVLNPAPIPALVNISDDLQGQSIAVVCSAPMPIVVPAGGAVNCTYSASVSNGNDRTNVATAATANAQFTGSAAVHFGDPSVETDTSASATFNVVCPAGFTCSAPGPMTFTGDASNDFDVTVSNTGAACDSEYVLSVYGTLTESSSSRAMGDNDSQAIYTCPCQVGCTLTIGYWKTHAGFTGHNADRVTELLPQWLGTMGGLKSVKVGTATYAVTVLSMGVGDPSNGITKLYAQLLGAKLNAARGASTTDIASAMGAADAFLANKNNTDWNGLAKNAKNQVIGWMSTFDNYNNGLIGPGHCN